MPELRPRPGRLRVTTSADGGGNRGRMLSAWRADPGATLIVAGALARHRVLAAEVAGRGTILGGTVDTMERLWRDVGRRADIPPPLDDLEFRTRVIEALADDSIPPVLSAMATRPGDVDRLVSHLKALDDAVGDDYPAQTPVEGGIADLRQVLEQRGVVSRARFRVLTARSAARITYDRPLVVAPPSAIRPTTGRLLTALAIHAPVTLYLNVRPGDVAALLDQLGIGAGDVEIEEIAVAAESGRRRLVEADDEVEVAVEQAAGWAEDGVRPEDIVICVPGDEAGDAAVQAAARRGLPVVAGHGAGMRDSLVGAVLERVVLTLDMADERPEIREDLLADLAEDIDGEALGLTRDDIEAIGIARVDGTLAEADSLHALGLRLAENAYRAAGGTPGALGPQLQQAHLWLDALRTRIDTLRAHDAEPPARAHVILEESVAVPRPRGATGGVAIVRPSEVASLGARHVVMTGLSAGSLPRPPAASPFTSRALLDAAPRLRPRDERTDLSAILATATSALTMVREPQGADGIERDPSPWFTEIAEGTDPPEVVSARDGAALRRRLQGRARAGHADDGPVAQALDALARHRRPPEFPDQPGDRISVTTLEEYLRCPLGWMVGRHMRPWSRGGVNLHMGNVADHALGAALTLGGRAPVHTAALEDRVAHAMRWLPRDPEWRFVPRDRRDLLEGWVEATARKYFDPDYMREIAPGWRPVAAQVWLQSTTIVDGFTITGQADRIDVTDHGILVIDWKLQRTIQIPEKGRRANELQKGLYPDMAAGSRDLMLPREVLGFMYVSVAHQDHVGSFTRAVGGGGAVDADWKSDNARSRERAAQACQGIRDKQVWDTGEYCDAPWCGHGLISTTARGGL